MPLYEYQCEMCGNVFEVRATIRQKEAGLTPECPNCHSDETESLITAGLVILNNVSKNAGAAPSCGCNPNSGSGCCR